jgi:predicted MFS family arabinose efflux permease
MLILAGMLLNLFIAALCLKEKSQTKEEKKNSEPDSIREIFNLPVILYCIAMLLNFSGKTAQFPFFVPYAESIGLSGYEPATIVLLINVVDIFSRPVGGQLGSSKAVQERIK